MILTPLWMNGINRIIFLVKSIKVTQSLNTLSGIACGINQFGQLILQDESGTQHFLSSGDTSLHEKL